jgi:hypothetical protein
MALWCSFWNRTKDDADRLGDRAEAKFNRWGDRINESVEDAKHAAQVRPASNWHLTCHLKPACACAHGMACTCRCRRGAIATAPEMQLRWHLPLSAYCRGHRLNDAVAVAAAKHRCSSACTLHFQCMVYCSSACTLHFQFIIYCYPACTHRITS